LESPEDLTDDQYNEWRRLTVILTTRLQQAKKERDRG